VLKNYLTIAIRNLLRHSVVSLVNLLGLGLGIGCCLLAVVFIRYELSWNNTHPHVDRIVLILFTVPSDGRVMDRAEGRLGPAVQEAVPEVEGFARSIPNLV